MLVAEHITKRFGSLTALDDVSITFRPGEIHAVLGENGAGKSTLMNILAGFMTPLRGSISLDEQRLPEGQAHAFRSNGIEMVHQHFRLVPEFTVAENLALAKLDRLGKTVDVKKLAARALEVGRELGWEIDPSARVRTLPVGVQQRIEILKTLSGDAKVIIFDEPTAVLSSDEVRELFRVLRDLKNQGNTVILIAHKLSEVMVIADRVTVLRLGKHIATAPISEVDPAKLAHWMVGQMPSMTGSSTALETKPGLEAGQLSVLGSRGEVAVRELSFEIGQGEILGIGGVDGNGQIELAETLALIRTPASGSITWKGQTPTANLPTIAYIPQDRQEDGLALSLGVSDNLLITGHTRPELKKGPFLSLGRVGEWVRALIERFTIKADSPEAPVASLSGGNQQKVVVARSLDRIPDLLVAVNPTRGLDVKATQFVYEQLLHAKRQGAAVALFSTDLDELAELADRTLYMSRGKLYEGREAALVGEKP